MREPRTEAERVEASARLSAGDQERFAGYGVMGLPFSSGRLLALRRFPASSVGPGFSSVWHWSPDGRWTFYTDVEPLQSCPRYFGNDISETRVTPIDIEWTGPRSLTIRTGDGWLDWHVELGSTLATRAMSRVGALLPDPLWRRPAVLAMMQPVAAHALGVGQVGLCGTVSNGQTFVANPKLLWSIPASWARIGDLVLDGVGPLPKQIRLGDFWLPQRGIFAVGAAYFEPFDPTRHLAIAARPDRR